MHVLTDTFNAPSRHRARIIVVLGVTLALAACGAKRDTGASASGSASAGDPRVVACTLMPKEEINAITGATYTKTDSSDDGKSSESNCHYSSDTDPAGMSVNINWIKPSDYSNSEEHAALQKAGLGGAKLDQKVTAGMPTVPGAQNGPIEGVGDEATMSMMLLTARKGDYTITVQIIPTNIMALMTDTTASKAFVDKEKAVAVKVLAKL